jgi:hypothetical protein
MGRDNGNNRHKKLHRYGIRLLAGISCRVGLGAGHTRLQ